MSEIRRILFISTSK